MKNMIFKNKKAAISILEAFFAISLIVIIVALLVDKDSSLKENSPEEIYSTEIGILRALQINESCRAEVLSAIPPVYWNDSLFPPSIKVEINKTKPGYLHCRAKVCDINSSCLFEEETEADIYVQSAFISANATIYSPKELKLFCWEI